MAKYRVGFVTNSSSSSYVCEVCGHDESGWDCGLSDAGMVECENGHTFCEDHMDGGIDFKEFVLKKMQTNIEYYENKIKENPDDEYYKRNLLSDQNELKELLDADEEEVDWDDLANEYEWRYSLPESMCPICSFGSLTDYNVAQYLAKKYNVDLKELRKELKENFGTYSEFKKYIE